MEIAPRRTGFSHHQTPGAGGMGVVYLAEQISVQRLVALKVLHPLVTKSADVIARFHREAVVLGMLTHNNIASIYASGVENEVHFLAMENCCGHSLQTLLDQRARRTLRCLAFLVTTELV